MMLTCQTKFCCSLSLILCILPRIPATATFLTSSYNPFTICDSQDPLNSTKITGIEIDLFREAMNFSNLTEGADYKIICTTWDDIFDTLKDDSADPTIVGAVSGITVTEARLKQYRFSQPTLHSGLSLLYRSKKQTSFYIRALSGSFFIVICCLPFVLGFAIYIVEGQKMKFINHVYHIMVLYFKLDDIVFLRVDSKVIQVAIKTAVMIVTTLYAAFTTNILIDQRSFGGILDGSSLTGLKIASSPSYEDFISSLNAKFISLSNSFEDAAGFIKEIEDNPSIDYVAYDDMFTAVVADTSCDIYETLKTIIKFDFGLMFKHDIDLEYVDLLNAGIEKAYMNQPQLQRWQKFLETYASNSCPNKKDLGKDYLSPSDFSGLWMVWTAGVAIGALSVLYNCFSLYRKQIRNSYFFTGIRARSDRKIQRKTAALVAFSTAVSLLAINNEARLIREVFRKKVLEVNLSAWLREGIDALKINDSYIKSIVVSRNKKLFQNLRKDNPVEIIRNKISTTENRHMSMCSSLSSKTDSNFLLFERSHTKCHLTPRAKSTHNIDASKNYNSDDSSPLHMLRILREKRNLPRHQRRSEGHHSLLREILIDSSDLEDSNLSRQYINFDKQIGKAFGMRTLKCDDQMVRTALEDLHQKDEESKKKSMMNFSLELEMDLEKQAISEDNSPITKKYSRTSFKPRSTSPSKIKLLNLSKGLSDFSNLNEPIIQQSVQEESPTELSKQSVFSPYRSKLSGLTPIKAFSDK